MTDPRAKGDLVYALTPAQFFKIMMFNIVFLVLALYGVFKILTK